MAVTFIVLVAIPLRATPVVDQSYTADEFHSLNAVIHDGCRYVAQSFTAGVTGTLTGVNIAVRSQAGAPPLRVAIRASVDDKPLGDPLGVRYLRYPQAPLTRLITFRQIIPVVAGQQYAIVVSYKGNEPLRPGGFGSWRGGTDGGYLGGEHFSGGCPTYGSPTFWYHWEGTYDLNFRTYVEPSA